MKIYRRFRPEYTVATFDDMFPGAEKLHRIEPETIQTPEILSFPLLWKAEHLRTATYTTPEDFTTTLHDVLYCPFNNVVTNEERQILAESVDTVDRIVRPPAYDGDIHTISGYSTLLRAPANAYYHTLIERMPRLLAIDRPPYSELEEIKLLLVGQITGLEEFYIDRLAPANVRIVPLKKEAIYRTENLIFTPFKNPRFVGYLPEPYRSRYRSIVLPDRSSRRCHRIYISREKQARRRIQNRDELMEALGARGFVSVIPEDLPLDEEIELFHDAEAIVGPHGSGFSNIFFSTSAKVIELYPTEFIVPHFYYMSKSLGHDYAFHCESGDDRFPEEYVVNVDGVLARLDSMGIS